MFLVDCRASVIGGLRTAVPRIQLGHALYQVVFDGRQRPLQFSEDCGGFDLLGNSLCHMRVCIFSMTRWNLARTSPYFSSEGQNVFAL